MVVPKFRAWDTVKKAMSEVEAIVYTEEKVYPFYSKVIRRYIPFSEAILMRSTGLFDKNGKEIFEGDVVLENGWRKLAVSFGTQEIEENFGDKRIFQGLNLCLGGGYPDAVMSDFEVIGNIYENPELVEVNNG